MAIPAYYFCQIQWGMGLLHKDRSLFGVWCPAGQTKALPFVGMGDQFAGEPQSYETLRHAAAEPAPGSRIVEHTVATAHGLIQITDVPFDPTFFGWMMDIVAAFWRDRYVPAAFLQGQQQQQPDEPQLAAEAEGLQAAGGPAAAPRGGLGPIDNFVVRLSAAKPPEEDAGQPGEELPHPSFS